MLNWCWCRLRSLGVSPGTRAKNANFDAISIAIAHPLVKNRWLNAKLYTRSETPGWFRQCGYLHLHAP